jgi:hypothetical protein
MKAVVTQEALDKAAAMRARGISWGRIARVVGFGEERVRRILDPGFAVRRAAGIRQARFTRGARGEPHRRLTDAEARQALATIPADTRSISAKIMGDPLPGRSALDKLLMRERTKNVSSVWKSPELLAPPKTGVLIGDHLNSGRVV